MSHKRAVWIGGIAAIVAIAGLGAVLLRGHEEPEARRAKKARVPAVESAPVEAATPPSLREVVVRTLPPARASVSRDELVRLLREAAGAYRARDVARLDAALSKVTRHGSSIQRILAEILLEIEGSDEQIVTALALQQVATSEIGTFAIALVQSRLPDEVKGIAIQLLTKFRTTDAAALLETLLFKGEIAPDLKALMIDYFAAVGGDAAAEVLARAAVDPAMAELRPAAAKALAKIGSARAAQLLYEAWAKTFEKKGGQALANYYLLQALATFDPALLRGIVKDALKNETDASRKNVFLSMLGKADRSLALDVMREVFASEKTQSIRQQAIFVLAAIGGAEAQDILLDFLAKGSPKEVLDSANALLQQEKLDVPFERVRELFGSMKDPMLRVVLAGVLARYEDALAADPALAATLMREAEAGLANSDIAVRGLSIGLSATLAKFTSDPADRLMSLYGSLNSNERNAFPVVFAELAKQPQDERVRDMLSTALGDDASPAPHRLVAADALFTSGGADLVYRTIGGAKDPELVTMMSGLALARGGDEAAKRLGEIAQALPDSSRRQIIENQVRVWNSQKN